MEAELRRLLCEHEWLNKSTWSDESLQQHGTWIDSLFVNTISMFLWLGKLTKDVDMGRKLFELFSQNFHASAALFWSWCCDLFTLSRSSIRNFPFSSVNTFLKKLCVFCQRAWNEFASRQIWHDFMTSLDSTSLDRTWTASSNDWMRPRSQCKVISDDENDEINLKLNKRGVKITQDEIVLSFVRHVRSLWIFFFVFYQHRTHKIIYDEIR